MLRELKAIQKKFNKAQSGKKKVTLADLIVLGSCAAVETAAKKAGTGEGLVRARAQGQGAARTL